MKYHSQIICCKPLSICIYIAEQIKEKAILDHDSQADFSNSISHYDQYPLKVKTKKSTRPITRKLENKLNIPREISLEQRKIQHDIAD